MMQRWLPALTLAALCPWIFLIFANSLNPDVSWLLEAAARLLDGQAPTQGWYETNPPYAALFHVPPVILSWAGIPVYYAAPLYFLTLIIIGAGLSAAILRRFDFIGRDAGAAILCAYLVIMIAPGALEFGQRDHVMMAGLLPFILCQYAIGRNIYLPRSLLWASLIFGASMIFLKVPMGLLPAVWIAQRAWRRRNIFSVLRDADFIVLAVATLIYACGTWFFFGDYVRVILPDLAALYIPMKDVHTVTYSVLALGIIMTALLQGAAFVPKSPARDFAFWLLICGAACVVPYGVQMKGFLYQLWPAISFTALGIMALCVASKRIPLPAALAIAFAIALIIIPPNFKFPRHADYRDFELSRIVSECKPGCTSYFFDNDSNAFVSNTGLYNGLAYGSRFSTLWFMPMLIWHQKHGGMEAAEIERLSAKYAAMVGEDFEKYQPDTLIIARTPDYDFGAWFSRDEAFRTQWKNYEKINEVAVNRADYFGGTRFDGDHILHYDIYHRH